jgi:hypothetical protein
VKSRRLPRKAMLGLKTVPKGNVVQNDYTCKAVMRQRVRDYQNRMGVAEHRENHQNYCVLRKDVNPNRCKTLYFDRSKFTYL